MDVWVISNPGPNAVGCPHPRPNPAEGRVDLQLGGFEFVTLTDEEYQLWLLSTGFKGLRKEGLICVEQCDLKDVPPQKPVIPDDLKPEPFDHEIAYQLAFAPGETDDVQFRRINMFRSDDPDRVWTEEADRTYLRTRHRKMLGAAQWYLEVFVDKRAVFQSRRLRDIKRQIKAIDALG